MTPGLANPLEEEIATHSGILAWEIPRTEELGGLHYSPWGCKRVRHNLATKQQLLNNKLNVQLISKSQSSPLSLPVVVGN